MSGKFLFGEINQALLSKCLWQLWSEENGPWKRLLVEKYSIGNLRWDINPAPWRASSIWRAICACVARLKQGIRFKVGHRDRVQFWLNIQCGSSPLQISFLLFSVLLSPLEALFRTLDFHYLSRESWFGIFASAEISLT